MDFFAFFLPGETRPASRAAEASIRQVRERAEMLADRAASRVDGLYALLGASDGRDAALVAGLLAEDLDALALSLGEAAASVADRAGLGPMPESGTLAAFARRAETRLDGLRRRLARRLAGEWGTPADRFQARALLRARTALLLVVAILAAGIVGGDAMARKRREFAAAVTLERQRTEAAAALADLAELADRAKKISGRPLVAVTGENCTRCGCDGRDLRVVPAGDVCVRKWDAALARIGRMTGASPAELAGLARDPWGSPYLLNENEGESPDLPCVPDAFASAGQNGLAGDGDDIVVTVPNAQCPKEAAR